MLVLNQYAVGVRSGTGGFGRGKGELMRFENFFFFNFRVETGGYTG